MFRLNDLEIRAHALRHEENIARAHRASRLSWTWEIADESSCNKTGWVSTLFSRMTTSAFQPRQPMQTCS
ncbi:MAG TPA: hypothetical protein VFI12_06550 [Thermomicrobiales bacterium]|jgi:hypothetical protein|nr:hypothetical protein [Thermomicrobiales bacterium]